MLLANVIDVDAYQASTSADVRLRQPALIFAGIDQGNYEKAVTGAVAAMTLALAADGLARLAELRFRRYLGSA